ncbi:DUF1345 domain-containing protein [Ruania zhangjianzhongii]|uniref:DUF1345 domain-containing protein n=1 Tax=Ruania zhangjianzhongii TaxID=2603206 RepID=UPI0011C8F26C|nr:DUF1345 domain-containing protein [Ruania zhangjianzhongii]
MGEDRKVPRLSADVTRSAISDWTSLAAALVAIVVVGLVEPDMLTAAPTVAPSVATIYLSTWSLRCLLYSVITWFTFVRADGDLLAQWLTEGRTARRKRVSMERLSLSSGPSGAVMFCAFALVVVVYCAAEPNLRSSPVVAALAALTVATSWLLILMVYTVHYAREDTNRGGLTFVAAERDGAPMFSDYFYLAVQVSTSFTAADVTVGSRGMRRAVTVHSIIGFVFSTAIIALLVSFLIVAAS